MDVCNTGNCNNGSDGCFFYFYTVQSLKFVKFGNLYFFKFIRIVMVYDYCILVYTDGSVIYFTNTDTAYIFIVVDSADENLCIGFRISLRCRDLQPYLFWRYLLWQRRR